MHSPGAFETDYAVLALLIVYPLLEWQWLWPRFVRAISAGINGARTRAYRWIIVAEWAVTVYILALWIAHQRSWSALWLGSVRPLRFSLGCALAGIVITFFVFQGRKVQKALANPKAVAYLREKLAFADPLMPATAGERRWFWLLSVTAGVCEEVIYRGFLLWLISAWTGLIAGVIISSIIFGFGHVYLGVRQVPRTAIAGLALALVVLLSGSLLPAIVIHASMDLNSGEVGFRVAQASLTVSNPAPLTS
jgi:uncharacterized protein